MIEPAPGGVQRRVFAAAVAILVGMAGFAGTASAALSSVTDDAFAYTGTWGVDENPSEHWSGDVGATASITFTTPAEGATVSLRAIENSANHLIGVTVDDRPEVTVDLWRSSTQNAIVHTSSALPAGDHTLTVRVLSAYGSVTGATVSNGTFGGPGWSAPPPSPAAPTGDPDEDGVVDVADVQVPGADWHLVLDQHFDQPAALGQFDTVYPGYSGYDGATDTSDNGVYDNSRTVSVAGGILDEHIRTIDGQPTVAALTPPIALWAGQTYGRYEVRFRSDDIPGYKQAWLLWPGDGYDWEHGEIDFPEGGLGQEVWGFSHQVDGDPSKNQFAVDTTMTSGDWHTAVIEWKPGSVTFVLDGESWTTTDPQAVPTVPMNWILQTETNLDGYVPDPSVSGHVQIDYLRAWTYAR